MKNNRLNLISVIIFYGAVWGIIEASVGYVLHLLPSLIAGTILFPFATIILFRVYKASQNQLSILGVGFVASMIKALNFLLPYTNVYKIINPMISIILESLVVMIVVKSLSKSNVLAQIGWLLFASIAWRVLFIGNQAIQYVITGNMASQIVSLSAIADFAILKGLLSGGISIGLFFLATKPKLMQKSFLSITPVVSALTLVFAILLTILL